jgi:hypothetical protein
LEHGSSFEWSPARTRLNSLTVIIIRVALIRTIFQNLPMIPDRDPFGVLNATGCVSGQIGPLGKAGVSFGKHNRTSVDGPAERVGQRCFVCKPSTGFRGRTNVSRSQYCVDLVYELWIDNHSLTWTTKSRVCGFLERMPPRNDINNTRDCSLSSRSA